MNDVLIQWLASDDTGTSSKSLAFEFLGVTPSRIDAPHDPADLGRCLRLIAKIPEVRGCVDSLGKKHRRWAMAAAVWDEIAACMADEVGIDWTKGRRAERTYEMMKGAGL